MERIGGLIAPASSDRHIRDEFGRNARHTCAAARLHFAGWRPQTGCAASGTMGRGLPVLVDRHVGLGHLHVLALPADALGEDLDLDRDRRAPDALTAA